jgi:alpha-glucoside transport system substrate-binding protein
MASVKGYIWYSPKKFAEWGVSVPTTWDEMEALGKTIAEKTGGPSWCAGFNSGEASGWPGTDWIEDAVLREAGPDVYDSWVAGDTPFTDPEIKAAFDKVGSILLDPTLVNAGYGDVSSINSTAFGDVAQNIASGTCALTHQASFFEGFLTSAGANVAEDGDVWAFLTPPISADADQAVTGGGEMVAAFSNDEDTAKVQEYLASADWANSRVKLGGVISANTGLDPENAGSDVLKDSIAILQDPNTTFRFDASDLMPKAVGSDSFFKGMVDWIDGSSTDQVLEEIQAGYTS